MRKKLNSLLVCAAFILISCLGCGQRESITPSDDYTLNTEIITVISQAADEVSEEKEASAVSESEPVVISEAAVPSETEASVETEIPVESYAATEEIMQPELSSPAMAEFSLSSVPVYNGEPYTVVNNNSPYFSEADLTTTSFEYYSELDSLGRCGVTYASIGTDLMPTEERGSIGSVKPTGWQTVKYDIVDGNYLYNRCHLIGYQLSGENANIKNLITGTRYLNINGMLPFENMVADYVKETKNHVMYRSTPVFEGSNLLASGVLLEGYSVEDNGDGICFNVFCYNVQPGILIDYSDGSNSLETGTTTVSASTSTPTIEAAGSNTDNAIESVGTAYILNTNTKKIHKPSCSSVGQMKESNKQEYTGSRQDLLNQGYEPCKKCNP